MNNKDLIGKKQKTTSEINKLQELLMKLFRLEDKIRNKLKEKNNA